MATKTKQKEKLTTSDYVELMNGGRNGGIFAGEHYIISKSSVSKDKFLLNGKVGLPVNMDEDHDKKITRKRRKKQHIDPVLLRLTR